jgi:hypothetical protein
MVVAAGAVAVDAGGTVTGTWTVFSTITVCWTT